MNPKNGYRIIRVYVPETMYDRLMQIKLLGGRSMSETVSRALERYHRDKSHI